MLRKLISPDIRLILMTDTGTCLARLFRYLSGSGIRPDIRANSIACRIPGTGYKKKPDYPIPVPIPNLSTSTKYRYR
jgi:hypothetical protein